MSRVALIVRNTMLTDHSQLIFYSLSMRKTVGEFASKLNVKIVLK